MSERERIVRTRTLGVVVDGCDVRGGGQCAGWWRCQGARTETNLDERALRPGRHTEKDGFQLISSYPGANSRDL